MPSTKRRWTFPLFLWTIVAALAFYLLCWPLIHNAWAVRHWEKVPCHVDQAGYTFLYQGKTYRGVRVDFWDISPIADAYRTIPGSHYDGWCYVPPGDPDEAWKHAILNLDAPQHLDHAGPGLVIVIMVSCVAILLTVAARKKSQKKSAVVKSV